VGCWIKETHSTPDTVLPVRVQHMHFISTWDETCTNKLVTSISSIHVWTTWRSPPKILTKIFDHMLC